MKDYYVKFNKKHSQMNVKLIQQASPEDFKKYSKLYNYNKETAELLEKVFFSPENVEILQNKIIDYVYEKSSKKILIGYQDSNDLHVIMKYIFNNHGRNTICESKVKQYIAYLNDKLINYVGIKVFTNAKQHIDYIKEISKPRKILALPKNVSKRRSIYPSNF
jgi:hypothetical protein